MGAVLYHGEPNGASLTVLAALAETGDEAALGIACRPIDLLAGERHRIPGLTERVALDMGIEGEGPVLVIDGEAMTESVFLAQYIDELAGGAGLQPADSHAHWEMMMWCRQITERLSPAAALLGNLASSQAEIAAIGAEDFAESRPASRPTICASAGRRCTMARSTRRRWPTARPRWRRLSRGAKASWPTGATG
jgi:GST-like protein